MTNKASEKLKALSRQIGRQLEDDLIELHLIHSSPFVAVGKSNSENYPFVLVVPAGTISKDEKTSNLLLVRSRPLEQMTAPNKEWPEKVGVIGFQQLTRGAELIIDLLVEAITNPQPSVSANEIIQDLIDIFKPSHGLDDHELIGLLGELAVISKADDIPKMIEAWHMDKNSRYDFSFANSRLEVKTSRGSRRSHFFSSAQLPPNNGIDLIVVSLLTEEVPDGVSVLSLFSRILEQSPSYLKRKFLQQFNAVFTKDEEKCTNKLFDLDLLFGSMKFFEGDLVPRPIWGAGVISAKWESDLTDIQFSKKDNELSVLVRNRNT